MAKPMTPGQFVKQLEKWHIDFNPYRMNWATHNRNHMGQWGPNVNGVMIHHTGSNSQDPGVLWNGWGNLPGPLCMAGCDNKGKLILTGYGRCNHAGLGDESTLNKVIGQNYREHIRPTKANVDGNSRFYSLEIMYAGNRSMAAAQRKTALLYCAAIIDFYSDRDWNEFSAIAHSEWQPGKWDPGYRLGKPMSMAKFRSELREVLKAGPQKPAPKKPAPKKPNIYAVKEDDSLWGIAEKFLGDGKRWPEIVQHNTELINLQPGDKLIIPKK